MGLRIKRLIKALLRETFYKVMPFRKFIMIIDTLDTRVVITWVVPKVSSITWHTLKGSMGKDLGSS